MTTVTGTGFAALAKNTETIFHNNDISVLAMFLTLISGLMAMFLTLVKLFSIFKKHLQRDSALHNHFVPTYLIIIPILTLFAISIFRIGHFAEHH
jgi:cytochrome b subunit of formate dehydrogenase